MIPASHFHDNGDGTAWVVGTEWWATTIMRDAQDRPCDTCLGRTRYEGDNFVCPDCIDGRHTFTVEVDHRLWMEGNYIDGHIDTIRVSVVPGMVLPIYDDNDERAFRPYDRCIIIGTRPQDEGIVVIWSGDGDFEQITLPPAAAPGMWAVKLAVQS